MGGSTGIAEGGSNPQAVLHMIENEIERMPRVYGGTEPGIAPRLADYLEDAWNEMNNFKDEYFSVEHLLLAVFNSDNVAHRTLKTAGLSRNQVLQALTSIRGAQRVTDQEPEGKYQALEKYGRNLTELARQGKVRSSYWA